MKIKNADFKGMQIYCDYVEFTKYNTVRFYKENLPVAWMDLTGNERIKFLNNKLKIS